MDIVYENFLKTFHYDSQAIDCQTKKIADFFIDDCCGFLSSFKEHEINVTTLKDEKYFISNCQTKGFFIEKSSKVNDISEVFEVYKKFQNAFGKITYLFGFSNQYFENMVEIFPDDKDSIGLGDFTEEFLCRTRNERSLNGIDIDSLFTIAYEANGNRVVLGKDNYIYIYAHDLIKHHYQKIEGIPKNTFYKIPGITLLKDFVEEFFSDFFRIDNRTDF